MATLDATVGGAQSNSYVTASDATALLSARLGTDAWDDADSADQEASLMWATQLLDEQVTWYGTPTTTTQALAWPQTGQVDHLGRPVPSDIVPVVIQRATATYALALLDDATTGSTGDASGTIKSRKIGDLQITYQDTTPTAASTRPPQQGIPAEVRTMLRPYAQMAGGVLVPLLRG
jgi:hypothetical protein